MFPLPPAWTYDTVLPLEAGIPELWDTTIPVINGTFTDSVYSSLPPPWARGTSISPKALHNSLPHHNQVGWARVWVEVKVRAHKQGLHIPKGLSTPSHPSLHLQISRLFRVHLCSFANGQEYYLIMVHH